MTFQPPFRVERRMKTKQQKEKQKMKKLMMVMCVAAVAAGCKTQVYKNDGGDADLRPTIVRDIAYEKYDVQSTPVESSDIRVGIFPGFFGGITVGGIASHFADNVDQGYAAQKTTRAAKNGAYAAACEAAKCDSLVGTRYEVKYNFYFLWDKAQVTVKGYPAKLTGVEFRKANFECPCKK